MMGYQRRGEFAAGVRDLQGRFKRPPDEIKWNKCSSSNVAFYEALIDFFFERPWLFFHCMIVERAWVDVHRLHDGSYDLARRKHFTGFLANKLTRIVQVHHGRPVAVRVYVDTIPSAYAKAAEAVNIIANRSVLKTEPGASTVDLKGPIEAVIECDSKSQMGIQICDLLLGAVVDSWNKGSSAAHKAHLQARIAEHLGWPGLSFDTYPVERKFNVWWLTDQCRPGQIRPVEARGVRLKKPLPPLRLYTR
jgi:hypothetical protein